MQIDFTGRHFQVSDRMRDFAATKLDKIGKFVDEPVEAHVILETADKHRQVAELIVHHRHGVMQATEEAEHMREALLAAIDKVEKQARRARKKFLDKRRRAGRDEVAWPLDVVDGQSLGSDDGPRVIKTSQLPVKPMTIDEAALQLDQSKNEFFVFLDSGSERVSVLYRRRDQHYGLIAPEF